MENNKKNVIFKLENGPLTVLSEILIKYGLDESREDAYQKIVKGEKPKKTIIIHEMEKLFLNETSEKDFLLILEREIKTEKNILDRILEDIKEKILSFAEGIIMKEENNKFKKIDNNIDLLKPSVSLGLEKK